MYLAFQIHAWSRGVRHFSILHDEAVEVCDISEIRVLVDDTLDVLSAEYCRVGGEISSRHVVIRSLIAVEASVNVHAVIQRESVVARDAVASVCSFCHPHV